MKLQLWPILFISLLLAPSARPQSGELSIDDAIQLGAQALQENVDPDALPNLSNLDLDASVKDFLAQFQQELNNNYVIDLAQLKDTAKTVLPLLQAHEETAPYAAWLKTRLDYFEAAEQLQKLMSPVKVDPTKPAQPATAPKITPELQRKVWTALIEKRPIPKEAQPYLDKIKPSLAANGVPKELAWLAEQESGFNPKAKSPAGAAGLFQLMPDTARGLGLSTWLPDERLNPDKITPAAAKHLKSLYGRFKDWKLALAAYNVGEGRLRSLMKAHKATTYEAVSPWLPAETRLYVPKFEALLKKREGITLAQLPAPK